MFSQFFFLVVSSYSDPNIWPHELDSIGDRAKGRFENVYWPQYDSVQRKYLMIAMKPKVRDHYHSHRLSYWSHLVPRLQMQQHFQQQHQTLQSQHQVESSDSFSSSYSSPFEVLGDDQQQVYYFKHHLLPDHENLESYDGVVRQISFRFSSSYSNPSSMNVINSTTKARIESSRGSSSPASSTSVKNPPGKNNAEQSASHSTSVSSTSSSRPVNPTFPGNNRSTQATPMVMENGHFPGHWALYVLFGGTSLLILNIIAWYILFKTKKNKHEKIVSSSASLSNCHSTINQHNDHHYSHENTNNVVPSESSGNLSATLRRNHHHQQHHHHMHHHLQQQQHSPRQLNQYQYQEVRHAFTPLWKKQFSMIRVESVSALVDESRSAWMHRILLWNKFEFFDIET